MSMHGVESSCTAQRIEAMLTSSGGRPVYLLVAPGHEPTVECLPSHRQLHIRQQWDAAKMRRLEESIGQQAVQRLSDYGKSVKWGYLVTQLILWFTTPEAAIFDAAWFVEPDVFYTGPWHEFFDAMPLPASAGLVAKQRAAPGGWIWCNPQKAPECHVRGKRCQCNKHSDGQTYGPIMRLSRSFAHHVYKELVSGGAAGNYEAVTGPLCRALPGCTSWWPTDAEGMYILGTQGKWGGGVLRKMKTRAAKCADMYLSNPSMQIGKSWGTLLAAGQARWNRLDCDTFADGLKAARRAGQPGPVFDHMLSHFTLPGIAKEPQARGQGVTPHLIYHPVKCGQGTRATSGTLALEWARRPAHVIRFPIHAVAQSLNVTHMT